MCDAGGFLFVGEWMVVVPSPLRPRSAAGGWMSCPKNGKWVCWAWSV